MPLFIYVAYIFTIVLTSYLLIKAFKHRYLPMAAPVSVICVMLLALSCVQIIEVVYPSSVYRQLLFDSGFLLLLIALPGWFCILYEYYYEVKIPWRAYCLLLLEPSFTFLLYVHDMFFRVNGEDFFSPLITQEERLGFYFMFHRFYMIAVALVILVWSLYVVKIKTQNKLSELLVFGVCLALPMVLVYLYLARVIPVRMGALALTLLLVWATRQYRLLDVMPVALRSIIDTIKTGVIVVNTQQKLIYANRFAAELFQFEDLLNHLAANPFPYLSVLNQYFSVHPQQSQRLSFKVIQTDRYVDATVEPVLTKQGRCVAYTIVLQDVSERQETEMLLREQKETLSAYHRQRSAFFTGISHEFKTPLTLSSGYIESILSGRYGECLKGAIDPLEISLRNNQQLLNLVDQLLELSQLDANALSIFPKPMNIFMQVSAVLSVFELQAKASDITIRLAVSAKAVVYFDLSAFDKVLYNLFSNAFKSMPDGGELLVELSEVRCDKGARWKLLVSDTGCGIDEDIQACIFEPFFYREHKHSGWPRGTGVGLSLVKQLLHLHHADISFVSEVGNGSQFTVSFLQGSEHFSGLNNPKEYKSNASARLPFTSQGTMAATIGNAVGEVAGATEALVLVVEDNADMRAYIRVHLGAQYRLIEASDGVEGVELARQLLPDLILSDVMMPNMDGLILCHNIKQHTSTSHIPVLLLTAKSTVTQRLEGLAQGADDYIVKPFNTTELQLRIQNTLQGRSKINAFYSHYWQQQWVCGGLEKGSSEPPFESVLTETFSEALTARADDYHLKKSHLMARGTKSEMHFLDQLHQHMIEDLAEPNLSIAGLADKVCMSERTLHRKVKALTGQSPKQLLLAARLYYASQLLRSSDSSITEIAHACGFSDASYFIRQFKSKNNQTPKEYRRGVDEVVGEPA